jgi:periplasmic protein CpxP/Spy
MTRINNKTLMIIIGTLLVSNLILLSLYLNREIGRKKTMRNRPSAVEYMTRELELNKEQSAQFNLLWLENNEKNKPLYDSIRVNREALYQTLKSEPQPDSAISAITDKMARSEKQLALNNYVHFRKLTSMCTPEQQLKLDSLLKKMGNKRSARRN